MSCNKENINRLSTITAVPHQNGRVVGQRTRITGSVGYLTAVCDPGYKFDGWYDTQGVLISDQIQLHVPSWMTRTVEPRYSAIIITEPESRAVDGNEGLLWLLELHGTAGDKIQNDLTTGIKYWSAGNFSTSPGRTTRILIDGSQTCIFPVTYGYNQGQTDPNDPSSAWNIGEGTYDENTNTVYGQFHRSPTTYDIATQVSLPDVLNAPKDIVDFPFENVPRGGMNVISCNVTTNYGWNAGHFRAYNSPTDGSAPTQFPLLKHAQVLRFKNTYHAEYTDFTGLEGSPVQNYYHRNLSYTGSAIRNMDAVSEWRDLRAFGTYGYNYKTFSDKTIGVDTSSPRVIEAFAYCNNLHHSTLSGKTNGHTPRQTTDVNSNSSWVSDYQTKPQCGSYLHPLRYAPLNSINIHEYTHVTDYSLLDNYYPSLKGFYYRESNKGSVDIDLSGKDLKNLTAFGIFASTDFLLSFDCLTNATNLTYLYTSTANTTKKITDLAPLDNKNLRYTSVNTMRSLIHDSLYDERVKLHMDFNSTNVITQDSTRHANKLNNHGATVVDT